jgi:hypothetical protein
MIATVFSMGGLLLWSTFCNGALSAETTDKSNSEA